MPASLARRFLAFVFLSFRRRQMATSGAGAAKNRRIDPFYGVIWRPRGINIVLRYNPDRTGASYNCGHPAGRCAISPYGGMAISTGAVSKKMQRSDCRDPPVFARAAPIPSLHGLRRENPELLFQSFSRHTAPTVLRPIAMTWFWALSPHGCGEFAPAGFRPEAKQQKI